MKRKFVFLPIVAMLLCGCGNKFNKTFVMDDDEFVIVNFADTQMDSIKDLNNTLLSRTIKKCIEDLKPDLITFSGDNVWGSNTRNAYKVFCNFMDGFKIPYCMVFGNHDREHATTKQIQAVVNASKYGYIEKGPDADSYGNYIVDIKNSNGDIVHKLVMMDSRDYYTPQESDYIYVTNPVSGMRYRKHNERSYYGSDPYDTIRGGQIDWYKQALENSGVESTVITHMPLLQYAYVYEDYLNAKQQQNTAKLEELSPVGECVLDEVVSCCVKEFGFFDAVKEVGSTKNIICGHDHINDFSLVYEGVRLSFALKTGDECYWKDDGTRSGCTQIKIDASGKASISYYFTNNC